MYRKFNILNMLVNGKLRLPDKIKLAYRYKKDSTGKAYVYVFGYKPDTVKPFMLTYQYELYDSECPRERTMTTIIELKTVPMITDYMLVISNYEELNDLYNVVGVFDDTEIPYGRTADDTEFDCGFDLQTFEINNGDIFTYKPTVTLNHTYFGGSPTNYRVSRYQDFSDTDWQIYTALPTTSLYTIGLNTFYFQLKTADEESQILSDSIGWHGATWLFYDDNAELELPALSCASDTAVSVTDIIDLPEPYSETLILELLGLSTTDSVLITLT